MSGIRRVRQLTDNAHLNFYEMEAQRRDGEIFPYYVASRARDVDHLKMNTKKNRADGVMIYGLFGRERDKVVLVRQFRYPVGDYIYEFPAGLVEENEKLHQAAIREAREETGLTFLPLTVNPMFERGYFTTDGMTDESCGMVYGYFTGEPSLEGLEATEELQVVLADRAEVRRLFEEEKMALPTAYMLMHFLHDREPFAFLKGQLGDD